VAQNHELGDVTTVFGPAVVNLIGVKVKAGVGTDDA
jgi:hypothetical protein